MSMFELSATTRIVLWFRSASSDFMGSPILIRCGSRNLQCVSVARWKCDELSLLSWVGGRPLRSNTCRSFIHNRLKHRQVLCTHSPTFRWPWRDLLLTPVHGVQLL